MAALVEQMLDLHKRLAAARAAQERTILQRQIDRLIYEPYNLMEEEIKIVEGATK